METLNPSLPVKDKEKLLTENQQHQPQQFGFRKPLPHRLIPTNVAGAFYSPAPAADFDPNTATQSALAQNGMFWRRPMEGDDPNVIAAWKKAFSQKWDPSKRIIPILNPQVGVTHRSKQSAVNGDGGTVQSQWSGAAVFGSWVSVSGSWTVPFVSKPTEPAGADGGWDSLSWIGIDGSGSNDVLQAGVQQSVDGSGNPSYRAWFEWFCTDFKVTLGETSPLAPSIASLGGNIFIAWKGDGNDNINIMGSPGNDLQFSNKFTSPETSSQAPVLCVHNNQLYVGWIGSGNNNINIARVDVDLAQNSITGISSKTTLPDSSPFAPALASVNNRLYVAWKGDSNDNLNVIYSADNGGSWVDKLTSPETSPIAPGLAAHNGKLFITWKGDGNDNINVAVVTGNGSTSTGFSNKVTLGDTSPCCAALCSWNGRLFISWKGDGNDNLNLMYSTDDGASFGHKYTSQETSPFGPGFTVGNDGLYICWRGDGNDNLNVSLVGFDQDTITGISAPTYLDITYIENLAVKPGDKISCSIQYLNGNTAGYISFANQTTGQHFSITLVPPPGANFSGNCVEWIMEQFTRQVNGITQNTSLPAFTPVSFSSALGCSAGNKTVANPATGNVFNVTNNGKQLTSVILGNTAVTIDFIG